LIAAGESAQRVSDMSSVPDMVHGIIKEAENILMNIFKVIVA
jgi:hypothetical protein